MQIILKKSQWCCYAGHQQTFIYPVKNFLSFPIKKILEVYLNFSYLVHIKVFNDGVETRVEIIKESDNLKWLDKQNP